MKRVIIIFWLMITCSLGFGQQVADYLMKAKALSERGNPSEAVKVIDEALRVGKESSLYVERANANIIVGDYSKAISDLNEANNLTPFSGEYGLARIYALKGDAATSLYHLEMNLKSALRKKEKVILLDPAFGPVENSPQWRQFWKKEWFSEFEKSISEIEYEISSGKIDESKEIIARLKLSYGSNDDILFAEASADIASGKYSDVIRIIDGLAEQVNAGEKYLRLLAKAQEGMANPSGASLTYTKLLNNGVADAQLLLLRAECYRKTGEIDKALKDLEKYLDFYPENKSALSLAGKVEAMGGDNLKALQYFSKNLDLHPNSPECYVDRANAYFVSSSWNWAIKDYSMALDLSPDNSDAWLNKGISLLRSGKTDDACHDFRKSFSLGNKRASEYISRECIK